MYMHIVAEQLELMNVQIIGYTGKNRYNICVQIIMDGNSPFNAMHTVVHLFGALSMKNRLVSETREIIEIVPM